MIIDDSDVDRYLMKRLLREVGAEIRVFEAESGPAALTRLHSARAEHPALLIFLDINMPLMSGHDFLRELAGISQLDQAEDFWVYVLTSSSRPEDLDQAGRFDFVVGTIIKGDFGVDGLRDICAHHGLV
jgi:CheY-like chemotaxis protein